MSPTDFKKRQFTNKHQLPLTENLKPKTQLVDLVKIGELEKGALAQVPEIAFSDGKARPLELTSDRYAKIFQKHWPFSHENLIATANDWDYLIKDLNGVEWHINLIKELPDGSSLLIGAKRENGAFVLTHFEPTKSLKKVLEDAKKNGGEVIEKGFNQLREWAETKYQQIEGTQQYGIADSTEKTVSWKDATAIRNIRNGRSVAEISEAYGIKLEIVDKITTPQGVQAYGKYGDGIITLADQIKEGTAPHELFHATFDLVDTGRKEKILTQVMENKKVDRLQAEEYLADSFSEYFRKGSFDTKNFGKGVIESIKQYFYKVKNWITGVNAQKGQIKKLFDEILDGEIDRNMLGEILDNKKDALTVRHQQSWSTTVRTSTKKSIQITDENASIKKDASPHTQKGSVGETSYKSSSTTSLAGALERSSTKSITISPENANNYHRKLNALSSQVKNSVNAEAFLAQLKEVFEVNKNSGYIKNDINDTRYTLRISNHSSKAWNNKLRGHPTNNTSVVIKLVDVKFKRNKSVDLIEFVYDPANLTPEKMQGIIKGVQDWIDTGSYTDKGYDATHTSVRASLENGEVKYQLVEQNLDQRYMDDPREIDVRRKQEEDFGLSKKQESDTNIISDKDWSYLQGGLKSKTYRSIQVNDIDPRLQEILKQDWLTELPGGHLISSNGIKHIFKGHGKIPLDLGIMKFLLEKKILSWFLKL